ncbi:MAG: Mu transposase C-terminal domain-containing protein [Elusimicrobiales bacterium]
MTENALTLRQISDLAKLPMNTLKSRARREGWPAAAETVINHKPARLFAPAALPDDLRLKLAPPPEQKPLALASVRPSDVPEAGRKTALARFDLLRQWRNWRDSYKGSSAAADGEFITGYNSNLFPQLRAELGEVSVKTLYRWLAMLDGSQDWQRLVPNYYGRGKGGPELSPKERDIFMGLLLQPNKPSIGTACRLVNFSLQKQGLALSHSPATFRRYAEHWKARHFDNWTFLREGTKALRDKVEPFIRRDPSQLEVGDVLVADGHRLNFQVINPFTGKPCRATFVGYVDWKSYCLAGYYIMLEENTQCIAAALRGAILSLGKMPKVCYQDNGRAFRSRFFTEDSSKFDECGLDGLFARLGICAVFAQPYNARAKVIEGWFNEFGNTFERLMPSYTGASIEDKPAWLMRNEKWHQARHNGYIPTISEAIAMIAQWLEFEGAQPCPHVEGKTRKQVFDEGRGPGVDPAALDDLMMQEKIGYIGRHGLRFLGADYWSDELYGLKQRAVIRYSLLDPESLKVYTEKEQFLCVARRVESLHPMARLGSAQNQQELERAIAGQKRLERRTMAMAGLELGRTGGPFEPPRATAAAAVLPAPESDTLRELHIPDSAVKPSARKAAPQPEAAPDPDARPFFQDSYQRCKWHIANGCRSDADRQWLAEYQRTREYQMLFTANEA